MVRKYRCGRIWEQRHGRHQAVSPSTRSMAGHLLLWYLLDPGGCGRLHSVHGCEAFIAKCAASPEGWIPSYWHSRMLSLLLLIVQPSPITTPTTATVKSHHYLTRIPCCCRAHASPFATTPIQLKGFISYFSPPSSQPMQFMPDRRPLPTRADHSRQWLHAALQTVHGPCHCTDLPTDYFTPLPAHEVYA